MNTSFKIYNAFAENAQAKISLDIDSKSDVIKAIDFELLSPFANRYLAEMGELSEVVTNRKLSDCHNIKRSHLQFETKNEDGNFSIIPMGLSLLSQAIEAYLGEDHCVRLNNQTICSCFNVSKKDIISRVINDKDFDVRVLVEETMATSGCGECLSPIQLLINETRHQHGLIKGLDNSRSRFDASGAWIKVLGLYPGELLIKLDDLKNEWLIANELDDKLDIEFIDLEGLHLSVKMDVSDDFKKKLFVEALRDYFKDKLKTLFFITAK